MDFGLCALEPDRYVQLLAKVLDNAIDLTVSHVRPLCLLYSILIFLLSIVPCSAWQRVSSLGGRLSRVASRADCQPAGNCESWNGGTAASIMEDGVDPDNLGALRSEP
jgi:hypothetical protein